MSDELWRMTIRVTAKTLDRATTYAEQQVAEFVGRRVPVTVMKADAIVMDTTVMGQGKSSVTIGWDVLFGFEVPA